MAFANEDTCTLDGTTYSYALDRMGNALITSCLTDVRSVAIPNELDGHPVTALGEGSFAKMTHVASISCPESVRDIGHHAFEQCRSLHRISFPAALESFNPEWLTGCSNLEEIVLPGMAPTIPQSLFGIGKIKALHVGKGTRYIELPRAQPLSLRAFTVSPESLWLATDGAGLYSFDGDVFFALVRDCPSYEIAEGCTRIEPYAFAYREALSNVCLPASLEEIGDLAFLNSGLRSFDAPSALKRIGKRAFMGSAELTRVTLNEGLREIGEGAFARTNLEGDLRVPSTVSDLGASVGGFPNELEEHPTRVRLAGGNPALFMDSKGLVYLRCDEGFILHDASCFTGTCAQLHDGTIAIANEAFKRHRFVERVVIPEGVTAIGKSAFAQCFKLTRASLPSTLAEIGEAAFFGASLRELHIPASCVRIGERALDTTARREAPARGGVKQVSQSSLQRATVDAGNPVYYVRNGLLCQRSEERPGESQAVLYVGPDTSVHVPEEVTSIAAYAFSGVTGIDLLHLHANIRSIGTAALFPSMPFGCIEVDFSLPDGDVRTVAVDLPEGDIGMNVLRSALYRTIDPVLLMESYDAAVPHLPDLHDRYFRMLDRLENPVLLADWARRVYERDLARDALRACIVLANHNCTLGLDRLVSHNLIGPETMSEVIDRLAGDVRTVTSIARLLELRRERFGQPLPDFAL